MGRPGSKKSPALRAVTKHLDDIENRYWEAYREDRLFYELNKLKHDQAVADWKKGKNKSPQLISPPEKQKEPVFKRLTTTDTTVEALCGLLAANPCGLAIVNDELSAWLRSMNQYKRGQGADRSHYLSMWNGARIQVDRKNQDNNEPIIIKEPFLTILGCIQPGVLSEITRDRGIDDGLLERFLFCMPESKYLSLDEKERFIPDTVKGELSHCVAHLCALRNAFPNTAVIPFSEPARRSFRQIDDETNRKIYDPDFNHALEAFYTKMMAYLARLSLILHVVKSIQGETQAVEIELETVQQAKCLTEYFLNHAQLALNLLRESGNSKRAKDTAERILRKGLPVVSARDLLAFKIPGCEKALQAKGILRQLQEYGYGLWNEKTERFIPYLE